VIFCIWNNILKMEAVCSSETLASVYQITWCDNVEDFYSKKEKLLVFRSK
jgi:hypothetical protein